MQTPAPVAPATGHVTSRMTRVLRSPVTWLALWIAALVAVHVAWLVRFRSGVVPEYDESGYMAQAMRDLHGLQHDGIHGFGSAFLAGAPTAPLVPLVTIVPYFVFGAGVDISIVTQLAGFVALAAATYLLGCRFMDRGWAALASGVTVALPVVSDYSRIFHFAVPAAALLTAAAWALASSDGLRRIAWAALAGALLGCMVLSRTMTISYLPGIGAAAVVMALLPRDDGVDRAHRLRALAVMIAAGALVAAVWFVPHRNFRNVAEYLTGTGYGEQAEEYGSGYSSLSPRYWLKQLGVLGNETQLPVLLTLTACVGAFAVVGLVRPRRLDRLAHSARRMAGSPLLIPTLIVLEGYVVLTSTSTVGTAFSLPWLPSLVLLCVYAVSRIPNQALRTVLVALLVATSLLAVAVKSDRSGVLAEERTTHVPLLGRIAVTDGDWLARADVAGDGYRLPPPNVPLPEVHEQWLPFAETEMRAVLDHTDTGDAAPKLLVATDSGILSTTRFALGAQLAADTHIDVERYLEPEGDDYARQLRESTATLLVTADPPPSGGDLDHARIVEAARDTGYVPFRTSLAPDGRSVTWWERPATAPDASES